MVVFQVDLFCAKLHLGDFHEHSVENDGVLWIEGGCSFEFAQRINEGGNIAEQLGQPDGFALSCQQYDLCL